MSGVHSLTPVLAESAFSERSRTLEAARRSLVLRATLFGAHAAGHDFASGIVESDRLDRALASG